MAEGKGKSFAECMIGILKELGAAEAYPDADPNIIQGVRELVLPSVQQQIASQDPMAQMQAMMGGGQDPMGGADPMQMQAAPTRLPRPGGDSSQLASALEFERQIAGTPNA